ncbi:MAG: DinB family protein [Chloroflexi bacterium]|nr:DinB family protein [Chloroflexota bacterium]
MDDLDEGQLRWRPAPQANHVGFLAWHALRIWDLNLGRMRGVSQDEEVWHTAGLRGQTGYDPRGVGTRGLGVGTGFTTTMVDRVPVGKDAISAYLEALHRATVAHLEGLTPADLERTTTNAAGATVTGVQLVEGILRHTYQHLGEADYVRGLLGIPDPTFPQDEE